MKNNINKWVILADKQAVPVLKHTIKELRHLCRQEDIPIKEITHVVERDPGLVIHILHNASIGPKGRLSSEITYINQAFRLMGTDQLTRLPEALPAIEDILQGEAKVRLLAAFNRAYLAARFATDWADFRSDMTPDEVFTATHLHFLGEITLSIHAPELLDKIAKLRTENNIASEEAQYLILGFTLDELSLAIAESWQLPALVKEALRTENANFPRAYGIMLGVQMARNVTYDGWYAPTTRNIQAAVAKWLDVNIDTVFRRTHVIAAEVAREIPQYDTPAVARLLPLIIKMPEKNDEAEEEALASICLIPQLNILQSALKELTSFSPAEVSGNQIINHLVNAMHDGIGLNRVVFCLYDKEDKTFTGKVLKGAENDPVFNRFSIKLDDSNIFSHLAKKQQAVLLNDSTRAKFWPLVPKDFQKLVKINSFIAMSIFIKDKPFGLFYADRHSSACQIEERSYSYFKTLCTHAAKVIEQLPNPEF